MNSVTDYVHAVEARAIQSVLHNMSCRPTKNISHEGKDVCCRISFSLWQLAGMKPVKSRPLDMQMLGELLGLGSAGGTTVHKRCGELAAASTALQSLPVIAPVLANTKGRAVAGLTDDISITLAVLGRCSDIVFIRRKRPVFHAELLLRRVTLILPEDWRFDR